MSKNLEDIVKQLNNDKKIQLIYAFNGTGKTRLSREFKKFISPKLADDNEYSGELRDKKILYYSSFTGDLFYWDNDLKYDSKIKLKIHKNSFTDWVFIEQGLENDVAKIFQNYTNEKLTAHFNEEYIIQNEYGYNITIPAYSEVTFSYARGDDSIQENIKISKGEESNFIWSIFYSLFDQIISELNIAEIDKRSTDKFNNLEYIFIDDPVSSLDENHLIELAVDIAQLIKSSESDLKFIITTHNPLFYNVLHNEFKQENSISYRLEKISYDKFILSKQNSDSPFAYQVYLKNQLEDIFKEELLIEELKELINYDSRKDKIESLFKNGLTQEELGDFYKEFPEFNGLYVIKTYFKKENKKTFYKLKFFKDKEIDSCKVEKFHFNFIRNILEKVSTFLGYYEFKELLPKNNGNNPELYNKRIQAYTNRRVNFGSHSKHSGEEMTFVNPNDKRVLKFLVTYLTESDNINEIFKFNPRYIKFSDLNI